MKLELSSLKQALLSLKKAITRSEQAPQDEELRDCVIQRFEYCYELSWKMLRRMLEKISPNPAEIDRLSFRDLLRQAGEAGFLVRVEPWFVYREQRNITSHTYDATKAKSVYRTALTFYEDAFLLFTELEKRND